MAPLIDDYYMVLEIERSADTAQIRRAYREQALKHHPDKNPDNYEEATERFQLIAAAYSVLSDSEQRAAYDAQCEAGAEAANQKFTDSRARDLFKDIFGEDFIGAVDRAKSGVIQTCASFHSVTHNAAHRTTSGIARAADRAGKVGIVRDVVASNLSSKTAIADALVEEQRDIEEASKKNWEKRVRLLHEHEESVAQVQKTREQKRTKVKNFFAFGSSHQRLEEEVAYDKGAKQKSELLRKMVADAAAEWNQERSKLEELEEAAFLAKEEVEGVQRNGATFGEVKRAGAILLGRVTSKLRRTNSASPSTKVQQSRQKSVVPKSSSFARATSC